MDQSQTVASLLLKEKAVFLRPEDPFTWASGIKAPVYCDNRLLISSVSARKIIIDSFVQTISKLQVDVIAGTATAGIPWAAWVAQEMKLPLIYVRSSSKDHGRKNAVEGRAEAGSKVILIEDLISTGKSSLEAAQKLREAEMVVVQVLSIFSYGFPGAAAAFESVNLPFSSLSSFSVLAQVAYDNKQLDSLTLEQVLNWSKSVSIP
jgi:orotate phosphoribosyltransferase